MNATVKSLLAAFLLAYVAGLGGCAGAFTGAKALGFLKPRTPPPPAAEFGYLDDGP